MSLVDPIAHKLESSIEANAVVCSCCKEEKENSPNQFYKQQRQAIAFGTGVCRSCWDRLGPQEKQLLLQEQKRKRKELHERKQQEKEELIKKQKEAAAANSANAVVCARCKEEKVPNKFLKKQLQAIKAIGTGVCRSCWDRLGPQEKQLELQEQERKRKELQERKQQEKEEQLKKFGVRCACCKEEKLPNKFIKKQLQAIKEFGTIKKQLQAIKASGTGVCRSCWAEKHKQKLRQQKEQEQEERRKAIEEQRQRKREEKRLKLEEEQRKRKELQEQEWKRKQQEKGVPMQVIEEKLQRKRKRQEEENEARQKKLKRRREEEERQKEQQRQKQEREQRQFKNRKELIQAIAAKPRKCANCHKVKTEKQFSKEQYQVGAPAGSPYVKDEKYGKTPKGLIEYAQQEIIVVGKCLECYPRKEEERDIKIKSLHDNMQAQRKAYDEQLKKGEIFYHFPDHLWGSQSEEYFQSCSPKSLVGVYDIIYVTSSADGHSENKTVKNATLTISDNGNKICGKVEGKRSYDGDFMFEGKDNGHFSVVEHQWFGLDYTGEIPTCTMHVFADRFVCRWVDNSYAHAMEENEFLVPKCETVQEANAFIAQQQKVYDHSKSWICNHLGLPTSAVSLIHEYAKAWTPPNPFFFFEKGDLRLRVEWAEQTFGRVATSEYVARKRPS